MADAQVPVLRDPGSVGDLKDWGEIPPADGRPASRISGRLLAKDGSGEEAGLWQCTPGTWRCEVEHSEFCYFLSGKCRYTGDDGEVVEIGPGTAAFFRGGWKGVCEVYETVRKVYMIGGR